MTTNGKSSALPPQEWLYSTQHFGIKLGLSNVERLLNELNLQPSAKVVQVAGTNGKGSTSAFLNALASAHGIKAGLFTSPHLISFTERIRVAGQEIPQSVLDKLILKVRSHVADWESHPTFFELSLILALMYFKASECDLIILETGMGGRLDATTAVLKDVAVLTPIGMDHQQYLGESLQEIATEKASIMRQGKPCISSIQAPQASKVIGKMATERNCPLTIVTEKIGSEYTLGLPGEYQRWNAALALTAFTACGYEGKEATIKDAFSSVSWPARFQKTTNSLGNPLIIDCAHNVPAIDAFVETWQSEFGDQKGHLIFGAAADKNISEVLKRLLPLCASVEVYTLNNPRGEKAKNLCGIVNELNPNMPCEILEDLTSYYRASLTLVVGSVFLAGEWLSRDFRIKELIFQ